MQTATFAFVESDEDIHTAVERRLGELIGAAAGKLHTGRSRNDQVATDFRLWMLEALPLLDAAIKGLQSALVSGRRAQPDYPDAGLHPPAARPTRDCWRTGWLSHFWALQRDRERLADLRDRVAVLPLGLRRAGRDRFRR